MDLVAELVFEVVGHRTGSFLLRCGTAGKLRVEDRRHTHLFGHSTVRKWPDGMVTVSGNAATIVGVTFWLGIASLGLALVAG